MVITDLLKQIPLFESLLDSERQRLASLLKRHSLSKGEILFHKGDVGSAFFIIIKGLIKIGVSNKMGDEVTLARLRDGDFFGEMALLDEQPRSADATALEDSTMYVLTAMIFSLSSFRTKTPFVPSSAPFPCVLGGRTIFLRKYLFSQSPPAWPNAFLNLLSLWKLRKKNPQNIESGCHSGTWPPCWASHGKASIKS